MNHVIPIRAPFSFAQSLEFIRRFPPCQGDFLLEDDSLTGVYAVGDRAVPFTLRAAPSALVCETEVPALAQRAANLVGASDDLGDFYAAARGDEPFAVVLEMLRGLHHVRFLSLEEIAVYSVMMQRAPVTQAARMKRAFLDRFGYPLLVDGRVLRAMPAFEQLLALDGEGIGKAIGHARKGPVIAGVIRGVAALGEDFLRTAPYDAARAALIAIPGIGPFSAGAILLRGLGRMDDLPAVMPGLDDTARILYGDTWDRDAIVARYGRSIGYWAYYLKVGVPRLPLGTLRARRRA